MTCPKCHGLLYRDRYKQWSGWTCANCGLVIDHLILVNKCHQQHEAEVSSARHAAEALFQQ